MSHSRANHGATEAKIDLRLRFNSTRNTLSVFLACSPPCSQLITSDQPGIGSKPLPGLPQVGIISKYCERFYKNIWVCVTLLDIEAALLLCGEVSSINRRLACLPRCWTLISLMYIPYSLRRKPQEKKSDTHIFTPSPTCPRWGSPGPPGSPGPEQGFSASTQRLPAIPARSLVGSTNGVLSESSSEATTGQRPRHPPHPLTHSRNELYVENRVKLMIGKRSSSEGEIAT